MLIIRSIVVTKGKKDLETLLDALGGETANGTPIEPNKRKTSGKATISPHCEKKKLLS